MRDSVYFVECNEIDEAVEEILSILEEKKEEEVKVKSKKVKE